MQLARFSGDAAVIFQVVRNMRWKQYKNTVPARVAGSASSAFAVVTPGIPVGTIRYPDLSMLVYVGSSWTLDA